MKNRNEEHILIKKIVRPTKKYVVNKLSQKYANHKKNETGNFILKEQFCFEFK